VINWALQREDGPTTLLRGTTPPCGGRGGALAITVQDNEQRQVALMLGGDLERAALARRRRVGVGDRGQRYETRNG